MFKENFHPFFTTLLLSINMWGRCQYVLFPSPPFRGDTFQCHRLWGALTGLSSEIFIGQRVSSRTKTFEGKLVVPRKTQSGSLWIIGTYDGSGFQLFFLHNFLSLAIVLCRLHFNISSLTTVIHFLFGRPLGRTPSMTKF